MHKPRGDVEISSSLSLACVCEAKFGRMSIASIHVIDIPPNLASQTHASDNDDEATRFMHIICNSYSKKVVKT